MGEFIKLRDVKNIAAIVTAGFVSVMLLAAPSAWAAGAATVVSKDNRVEMAGGAGSWAAATAGQELQIGDRLKTGEDSRATVRMSDGSVLQMDELTTIEIKAPKASNSGATLSVPGGAVFFSNSGRSREVGIETPSANGAIRGTAFLLRVRPTGESEASMIEGLLDLSNSGGVVSARPGEQARAAGNAGPAKSIYGDTGDTGPWYLVIEGQFRGVKSLRRADKLAFMNAVPNSIKRYRQVAPQLSGGAVMVRKEWARDVLKEAFKAVGSDCGMRGRILHSVIAAAPELAAELTELAVALGPDCAGAFGGGGGAPSNGGDFGNPPDANSALPPADVGGSGGGGQGNVIAICHNGHTIFVSPQGAEFHLRNHRGDTLGPCQVTPVTNR